MPDTEHRFTLVAMPPSGEVYLARDDDGVLWLIPPPGTGPAEPVGEEVVERAVVDHGFERVEASFPTWDQLDAERQRRAGVGLTAVQVDFAHFDADDVRRLLGALDRALRDGQVARARSFATRLLTTATVRGDDELEDQVVSFLLKLDAIPASVPSTVGRQRDPLRQRAYERVRELQAA